MTLQSIHGIAGPVRSKTLRDKPDLYVLAEYVDDDALVRRELYDGSIHTIVPAVLAVDGVMNGARVSAEELARHVGAWNGRPIVLLHPEDEVGPISAAAGPDILERRVGTVFGATVEDAKLKAELWIDESRMDALSASALLGSIVAGELVEVSTGYFADDVAETGTYNGREYQLRHVNLRPDHLALLPGQVGACSVADGCGVPRINRREHATMKTSVRDGLSAIMSALGFKTACLCEETTMTKEELIAQAKALKTNGTISAKQLKMLEEAGEDELEMMVLMAGAMLEKGKAAAAQEEPDDEDEAAAAAAAAAEEDEEANKRAGARNRQSPPKQLTQSDINKMIASGVETAITRRDLVSKLVANEACPLDEDDVKTMTTEALGKLEKKYRTTVNDYSGQGGGGGMFVHGNYTDEDAYVPPRVVTAKRKKKGEEHTH